MTGILEYCMFNKVFLKLHEDGLMEGFRSKHSPRQDNKENVGSSIKVHSQMTRQNNGNNLNMQNNHAGSLIYFNKSLNRIVRISGIRGILI